jgi:hypothetical protein
MASVPPGILSTLTGLLPSIVVGSGLQMFIFGKTTSHSPEPRLHIVNELVGSHVPSQEPWERITAGVEMGVVITRLGYLVGIGVGFILSIPTMRKASYRQGCLEPNRTETKSRLRDPRHRERWRTFPREYSAVFP